MSIFQLNSPNLKIKIVTACVDQTTVSARLDSALNLPAQLLSPRELHAWENLGLDKTRKLHWLMGRLAAKQAILKILSDALTGTSLKIPGTQADTLQSFGEIEILNAQDGSPYVYSQPYDGTPLQISIAHTDGLAIAAAAHPDITGLGVDVERADRYEGTLHGGEDFPQMTFSNMERTQIERYAGAANSTILTRVWTAKEAAGKAAKLGLGRILKLCRFVSCSHDLSVVTLQLCKESSEQSPHSQPGSHRELMQIDVCTVQEQDFYLALAVIG